MITLSSYGMGRSFFRVLFFKNTRILNKKLLINFSPLNDVFKNIEFSKALSLAKLALKYKVQKWIDQTLPGVVNFRLRISSIFLMTIYKKIEN
jgi:hypothetical protein